jgi:ATP-dependent helicase HrpA
LVHPGFVTSAGRSRLPDLQRYLRALLRRVEVVAVQPQRDAQHLWVVQETEAEWERAVAAASPDSPARDALDDVRWMLEELRVSLFAQGIGTPKPVSPQRVRKAIAAAAG